MKSLISILCCITLSCSAQVKELKQFSEYDTTHCPNVSYDKWFTSPHGIKSYFDYNEGLLCSKVSKKPMLVYFTGHGIVNARKMEELVWSDNKILNLLKTKFVVASLYVDDRALILSKEKQVVSVIDKDTIKVYGKKQCYIQEIKFKDDKTPSFFIIDSRETVLAGPYHYNISKKDFLKFLNYGLRAFEKKK